MVQYGVVSIDDVMWSYGPGDRMMLEEMFPSGTVVEIMGTDRLGVVLGNLRMMHPIKGQPHVNLDEGYEVDPNKGGWRIDVLVGTEKKPLDPWMLSIKEQTEDNEERAWTDENSSQ